MQCSFSFLNRDLKCSLSEHCCLFLEGVCECLPKPLNGKLENWTVAWGTSRPDVFLFVWMEDNGPGLSV